MRRLYAKDRGKISHVSLPPTPPDFQTILNTPPGKLPRNKRTQAIHKREVWWQIYFPLLAGLLGVGGLIFLIIAAAISPGAGATRVWSQVSTVFLTAQAMAMALPLLILFAGLFFGVTYLLRILPPYSKIAQDYTALAALRVEHVMRYVLEPVLRVRSGVAGFDRLVQNVRRFFGHRRIS